jgi:hypothetical protein
MRASPPIMMATNIRARKGKCMEPLLNGTNESIERIKGLSSEHLKILADRLKKANKGYQYLPQWRETQIVHFLKAIALHVEELGKGYAFERADLVAMSARNLLELNIWVLFCNLSADKAEHFFYDCARDVRELMQIFQQLHSEVHGPEDRPFDKLHDRLREAVEEQNVKGYEEPYRRVHNATREVNLFSIFNGLNKICSKLVHPTSLMINLSEYAPQFNNWLFTVGEANATMAVSEIDKFIASHVPSTTE